MKVSYNWLKDYCDCDLRAHELAARLSHSGLGIESYEPRGDDWMLDAEVKSNRPDCLCHLGVAREIAAITGGTLRRPEIQAHEESGTDVADACRVEVEDAELCPHYTARVIRGAKVTPSPGWLQERLTVCGIRPINNVVDITNYVMLETGQPLHAFDLALVRDSHIIVRRATAGETITTIDGTEVELAGDECVIADPVRPVALAGVMGGLESEINEDTTDILLEAARFAPTSIRRTSRRHALSSESSYRFERGVDPEITDWASRRACAMMVELAGGALLEDSFNIRADTTATPEISLRYDRLALLLGMEVPRDEVKAIFRGLELDVVEEEEATVTVRVPSWRGDLEREVDLIEEVARVHGYDKISETTDMSIRATVPSTEEMAERRTRRLVAGQGFHELMTYSLVEPTGLQTAQPWTEDDPVPLRNPVTVDRTHLRVTNMANLVGVKRFNAAHGTRQVDVFEIGRIFIPTAPDEQPDEKLVLTLLTDRPDGLRVLKGVLANLLQELGVEPTVREEPEEIGPFAPHEGLALHMDGELFGCAGVLDARFAEEMDLPDRPALMEVDLAFLLECSRLDRAYEPIPSFPQTQRDLAIVVPEDVLWADIERTVRESAPDTLVSIEMFDVYRGQGIPSGRKSVAFSLTFRREDRTITSEEAEEGRSAILAALESELDAELR